MNEATTVTIGFDRYKGATRGGFPFIWVELNCDHGTVRRGRNA
jgi:hypothetical protein